MASKHLQPIVGYATLTQFGTVEFVPGAKFPPTTLCLEVLKCGHTNYTPRWEGQLQVAQSRQCKRCAKGEPRDIPAVTVKQLTERGR